MVRQRQRQRRRTKHERPQLRWKPLWVRWHSGLGRWTAEVRHLGATTFLGHYAWVSDAVIAVNVWLASAHGGLWAAWRSRRVRHDGRRRAEAAARASTPGLPDDPSDALDRALMELYGGQVGGAAQDGPAPSPVDPDDPWALIGDEE